jgi:DNA-binding response OmpR family regulator
VLKNLTVLCAEDEKAISNVLVEMITPHVAELFVAYDGEEAYSLYKEHKPDLIITDINMPKIAGLDLVRMIRKDDHDTKVVVLTAHSDVEYLLKATELKLTKYLIKPFSIQELFEALEMAVSEKNSFKVTMTNRLELDESFIWEFQEKSLVQDGEEIHLTPKEKGILNILFSNLNSTVTYDMLMDEVWDDSELYSIDTIKTMIKNLRKKLPKDTILNVYGTGFKVKH